MLAAPCGAGERLDYVPALGADVAAPRRRRAALLVAELHAGRPGSCARRSTMPRNSRATRRTSSGVAAFWSTRQAASTAERRPGLNGPPRNSRGTPQASPCGPIGRAVPRTRADTMRDRARMQHARRTVEPDATGPVGGRGSRRRFAQRHGRRAAAGRLLDERGRMLARQAGTLGGAGERVKRMIPRAFAFAVRQDMVGAGKQPARLLRGPRARRGRTGRGPGRAHTAEAGIEDRRRQGPAHAEERLGVLYGGPAAVHEAGAAARNAMPRERHFHEIAEAAVAHLAPRQNLDDRPAGALGA